MKRCNMIRKMKRCTSISSQNQWNIRSILSNWKKTFHCLKSMNFFTNSKIILIKALICFSQDNKFQHSKRSRKQLKSWCIDSSIWLIFNKFFTFRHTSTITNGKWNMTNTNSCSKSLQTQMKLLKNKKHLLSIHTINWFQAQLFRRDLNYLDTN